MLLALKQTNKQKTLKKKNPTKPENFALRTNFQALKYLLDYNH